MCFLIVWYFLLLQITDFGGIEERKVGGGAESSVNVICDGKECVSN